VTGNHCYGPGAKCCSYYCHKCLHACWEYLIRIFFCADYAQNTAKDVCRRPSRVRFQVCWHWFKQNTHSSSLTGSGCCGQNHLQTKVKNSQVREVMERDAKRACCGAVTDELVLAKVNCSYTTTGSSLSDRFGRTTSVGQLVWPSASRKKQTLGA